jgi:hypothetical protein
MVLKPEPMFACIESIIEEAKRRAEWSTKSSTSRLTAMCFDQSACG